MPLGGFDTYAEIVKRLKSGNERYLDLGCCFGQDIRRLVTDGVPGHVLTGSDLRQGFLDLGYDLFQDRDKLQSKMIAADIFAPGSGLGSLQGNIDIIHASSFFHLFDYEGQKEVARRVVQLLRPQKDSLLVGRQVGNMHAHEETTAATGNDKMYLQNVDSWKHMWKEIGHETGTQWEVEAVMKDWPEGRSKWHNEGTQRIFFSVRRS
jgi:SAM-dependent methyltransferase